MGAGLCCGMSGLAAGVAIGVAGDAGVRAVAKQGKMYVGMVLILIFAEAAAPSRALCPSRRLHAASVPPTTSPAAATAPPGAARAARANPAPPVARSLRSGSRRRHPPQTSAQALGLYGLIIGLIMTSKNSEVCGAGPVA